MSNEPWEIPESWSWTRMGQVSVVIGGSTPSTADSANFENGTVPWITPADLSGYRDKFISTGKRSITERGLMSSGARMMPAGTVLFSSRAPIGYVAIAANALSTNQGFKSFVLDPALFPDYVYYYLQRGKELALELASGTTFAEISGKSAHEIPLPLPPLQEQHRIVAEIEKQFTRLDAAMAALERVRANIKRYRAATLAAACEGRLVPTEAELARAEEREYEDADRLLARLGARSNASQPVNTALRHPYELPIGWTWSTPLELCDGSRSITYGVIKLGDGIPGGVATLRSSDVRSLRLNLERVKTIDPAIAANYRRTFLRGGEVLITVRGTLGGVVVAPGSVAGFNVSREVAVLPARNASIAQTLATFIASPHLQRWIVANTKGITYRGLNIETLKVLPVPVPPLAEQHRIVGEVERRLSLADKLDAVASDALRRGAALRQSILKRAFAGELVPQDPNDAPASMLLERIRAERAARASNGARSKKLIRRKARA
ncbi:MAG: restriction endonuclease subunit S [Dehalococcoidia bacterium]